jgi:hypothetical protein
VTNSTNSTNCQCQPGSSCGCAAGGIAVVERPRYYARQLITPGDMTLEQDYFRERLRRHNRYLHGWGVVCGAMVCPVVAKPGTAPTPWLVQVNPGYILGPYGDEILIEQPTTLDLSKAGGTSLSNTDGDPWCAEVTAPTPAGPLTYYVAIKYVETPTRPVRVSPSGCGCQETSCEYSRVRDGFEINTLAACPATNQSPPDPKTFFSTEPATCPPCPPCAASPWVVLARVDLDSDGTITAIDNCSCRRIVLSAAPYWLQCTTTTPPAITVVPTDLVANGVATPVVVNSVANFDPGVTIGISGSGVTLGPVETKQPNQLSVPVTVATGTQTGPRTLTLMNANCSLVTLTVNIKTPDIQP